MLEILTVAAVIAGFSCIVAVGAKLGAGSPDSLTGLFVSPNQPPRPRGVQESDLPPFVFRDTNPIGTGASA